jgi:hypothetical protein
MKRHLVWRPRPGLRLVVALRFQPPRFRPALGTRLALRAGPWLVRRSVVAATRGGMQATRGAVRVTRGGVPPTAGGGGVMRKQWVIPVAVAAAGLGALVWAGRPALRRYLKMERM